MHGKIGGCAVRYAYGLMMLGWAIIMAGALADPVELPDVFPSPQAMQWAGAGPEWLSLDALNTVFMAGALSESTQEGLAGINARLLELGKPALQNTANGSAPGLKLFLEPVLDMDRAFGELPAPHEQGYRLAVTPNSVILLGKDQPGLYYGLLTLRQLLRNDGRIPRVIISDWPDFPVRGTYIGYADPLPRIAEFASKKLNLVLFENGDFFHLDNPELLAKWQAIFAACRKQCIEPVPEVQSLGWGHLVLAMEPRAAEGMTAEKMKLVARQGTLHAEEHPAPPDAVLINAGFEDAAEASVPDWAVEAGGDFIRADNEVKHEGRNSLRIHREEKGTMRAWQDVVCLPNARYELSCFLKTQDIQGAGAYIEVYGLEPSGELGKLLKPVPGMAGTQDWRRTAGEFATEQYARLRVYLRIQEATGTAWFDEVMVRGLPVFQPFAHALITEAAPLVLTDAEGKHTFREGTDYNITGGSPKEPVQITLPPGGSIHEGETVLATFTYAPPDSVTCCPSEPLYQRIMKKTLQTVIRELKPRYLHIGHDEPRVLNRDLRCTNRQLSNAELFVDDIMRMREYVMEADTNVRMMMWDDAISPHHNAPALGMEKAAEMLPKDIIQCLWWYDYPDPKQIVENKARFFLDLGFEITGSPWFNPDNAKHWARVLDEHRKETPRALGILYTSWGEVPEPWKALDTAAECAWNVAASK